MKKLIALGALLITLSAQAFRVDTVAVATPHLETPLEVVVIQPTVGDYAKGSYDTVYLLNGFGGDHKTWYGLQPRIAELADLYGMVMVMPNGRDTWYWNSPVDPAVQMEDAIIKSVVPYIDSHYPTVRKASHRAITGLSMGGHGAMWLATRHPDVFGSMGSMSGGVDIRPFPGKWRMAERIGTPDKTDWDDYTVATLVPVMAKNGQNITFDCGSDDFFFKVNNELHDNMLKAGVKHDYTVRPGGHSGTYWKNSILYHLLFFREAFDKAE